MPFKVGDVVTRKTAGTSVQGGVATALAADSGGRICKVVTKGVSYKVAYDGIGFCVLQFEDSLTRFSGPAPKCPGHSTCQ